MSRIADSVGEELTRRSFLARAGKLALLVGAAMAGLRVGTAEALGCCPSPINASCASWCTVGTLTCCRSGTAWYSYYPCLGADCSGSSACVGGGSNCGGAPTRSPR